MPTVLPTYPVRSFKRASPPVQPNHVYNLVLCTSCAPVYNPSDPVEASPQDIPAAPDSQRPPDDITDQITHTLAPPPPPLLRPPTLGAIAAWNVSSMECTPASATANTQRRQLSRSDVLMCDATPSHRHGPCMRATATTVRSHSCCDVPSPSLWLYHLQRAWLQTQPTYSQSTH